MPLGPKYHMAGSGLLDLGGDDTLHMKLRPGPH